MKNKFEAILEGAILQYARAGCLALTKELRDKLPCELRDMIYNHLLDSETAGIIRKIVRVQMREEWDAFDLPHLLNHEFVDDDVIAEILNMAALTDVKERSNCDCPQCESESQEAKIGIICNHDVSKLQEFI